MIQKWCNIVAHDSLVADESKFVGVCLRKEIDHKGNVPQVGYRLTGDYAPLIMGFMDRDKFSVLGLSDPRLVYPSVDKEIVEELTTAWQSIVDDLRNSGISQMTVSPALGLVREVTEIFGFEIDNNPISNLLLKNEFFSRIPGLAIPLVKKL